jgi:serine/threonine protein kinase
MGYNGRNPGSYWGGGGGPVRHRQHVAPGAMQYQNRGSIYENWQRVADNNHGHSGAVVSPASVAFAPEPEISAAYSDSVIRTAFPDRDLEISKNYVRKHESRWIKGYFPDLDETLSGYRGEIAFDVAKYDDLDKLRAYLAPYKVTALLDKDKNEIFKFAPSDPNMKLSTEAAYAVAIAYTRAFANFKENVNDYFRDYGMFGREITYFPAVLMEWAPHADFFWYTWQLHDEAKRRGARAPRHAHVALDLLKQLLQIVDAMHQRGVIHRDIKAENVLITGWKTEIINGKCLKWPIIQLCDFGLSRHEDHDAWHQGGTEHMSPPEILGYNFVDRNSFAKKAFVHALDIWPVAIFVLFYVMLRNPFDRADGSLKNYIEHVQSGAKTWDRNAPIYLSSAQAVGTIPLWMWDGRLFHKKQAGSDMYAYYPEDHSDAIVHLEGSNQQKILLWRLLSQMVSPDPRERPTAAKLLEYLRNIDASSVDEMDSFSDMPAPAKDLYPLPLILSRTAWDPLLDKPGLDHPVAQRHKYQEARQKEWNAQSSSLTRRSMLLPIERAGCFANSVNSHSIDCGVSRDTEAAESLASTLRLPSRQDSNDYSSASTDTVSSSGDKNKVTPIGHPFADEDAAARYGGNPLDDFTKANGFFAGWQEQNRVDESDGLDDPQTPQADMDSPRLVLRPPSGCGASDPVSVNSGPAGSLASPKESFDQLPNSNDLASADDRKLELDDIAKALRAFEEDSSEFDSTPKLNDHLQGRRGEKKTPTRRHFAAAVDERPPVILASDDQVADDQASSTGQEGSPRSVATSNKIVQEAF